MTDNTNTTSNEQPEVEGHGARFKAPVAADVEGHAIRVKANDAEAPADETTVDADENRDTTEPEVERHKYRWG